MHLTYRTDYSIRVLLYLALHPDRLVTTREISEAYGISKNHLVRVVLHLNKCNFIENHPGRTGGVKLARPADSFTLGDVVRLTEPDFHLVECFNEVDNTCPIISVCSLKGVLKKANSAFLGVLDSFTLADLVKGSPQKLKTVLQIGTLTEKKPRTSAKKRQPARIEEI